VGKSIRSFAGGTLTFLKLTSASVGLVGVSEMFLEARIAKSLLFGVLESFDL